MVTLPPEFIAVYIPGYFWNHIEQTLYSVKSGVLKRINKSIWKGSGCMNADGFMVSHLGVRRHLYLADLIKLVPFDHVIAVDRTVRGKQANALYPMRRYKSPSDKRSAPCFG